MTLCVQLEERAVAVNQGQLEKQRIKAKLTTKLALHKEKVDEEYKTKLEEHRVSSPYLILAYYSINLLDSSSMEGLYCILSLESNFMELFLNKYFEIVKNCSTISPHFVATY